MLAIQTRLSGKQALFQGTSPDLTRFKDQPERQNAYLGATGKVELSTPRLYFITLFFFLFLQHILFILESFEKSQVEGLS